MLGFILGIMPGLANTLAAWVTAQGNTKLAQIGADKDVAIATLAAETAANQAKAAVMAIPGMRWILFSVYFPPAAHAATIIAGLMRIGGEWNTLPLSSWEENILLSLVILVPGTISANALHNWASK